MLFYCLEEGGWVGNSFTCNNAYDGEWHKYSLYINYNTGIVRRWYDVNEETAGNANKVFEAEDGKLGTATGPRLVVIQGNFGGTQPSEETFHALDDIEVWDRMPGTSGCNPVHPADNNPCDSFVSITELIAYINSWIDGEVTLQNVMGAIIVWKG